MFYEKHIYLQADALCSRLQLAAFRVLMIYSLLPYNEPRAYTDPRVVRLQRLIVKANARRSRRYHEYCRIIRAIT